MQIGVSRCIRATNGQRIAAAFLEWYYARTTSASWRPTPATMDKAIKNIGCRRKEAKEVAATIPPECRSVSEIQGRTRSFSPWPRGSNFMSHIYRLVKNCDERIRHQRRYDHSGLFDILRSWRLRYRQPFHHLPARSFPPSILFCSSFLHFLHFLPCPERASSTNRRFDRDISKIGVVMQLSTRWLIRVRSLRMKWTRCFGKFPVSLVSFVSTNAKLQFDALRKKS